MSNRKQSTTGKIPRKVKANTFDTRFNPFQFDDTPEQEKSGSIQSPKTKHQQGQGTRA